MFHCSLVDRRGTTIITIPENALGIISLYTLCLLPRRINKSRASYTRQQIAQLLPVNYKTPSSRLAFNILVTRTWHEPALAQTHTQGTRQ